MVVPVTAIAIVGAISGASEQTIDADGKDVPAVTMPLHAMRIAPGRLFLWARDL